VSTLLAEVPKIVNYFYNYLKNKEGMIKLKAMNSNDDNL